eukprot:TRINITY_DN10533_c0_g1_i1.p1 TRINITY_DN10533_c0_g1~~TRINITY_DN10533_c0_g1_i1.p1  ORF type:complete len:334 (+),score=75.43 TRINITY_DN10533_c0_g1_i1:3-1004(+)
MLKRLLKFTKRTYMTSERRTLYPPIEAYDKNFLQVSPVHNLYYEQAGNPNGKQTVIVLHGGPGGGIAPWNRQFFNPDAYRIVLFDQRGAGKSTPMGCLEENTTWHLVEDIEKLREHLKIDKWVVFGGSWGSTLALSYAEKHPERVKALILRGIFLLRRKELLWFYQDGASYIFPDVWEKYLEPIPKVERGDLMSAYHRRLTGPNIEECRKCAKAWTTWEMSTSSLFVNEDNVKRGAEDDFAYTFARIECHYFVNGGFFERDGQLLEDAHKIKDIPGVIVQGRYDVVCPATSAWDLHKQWPKGELIMVPDAGHSMKEAGILSELVKAGDKFADL